jgi:hypothetical protein
MKKNKKNGWEGENLLIFILGSHDIVGGIAKSMAFFLILLFLIQSLSNPAMTPRSPILLIIFYGTWVEYFIF